MTKNLLLFFLTLILSSELVAQSNNRIKGQILNYKNEPLQGISVVLLETELGTTTSSSGEFELKNIPDGKFTLQASGVGFSLHKKNVEFAKGRTLLLNLQLNEEETVLNEVVVTSNTSKNYNSLNSRTDKLNAKLQDIPQSIEVVNRNIIEDRQAFQFKDVIRNTTGVSIQTSSNDIMIRGFSLLGGSAAGSSQFINGMRNFYVGYSNDLNLTNIESIEIIKGPASVLFGANSPGGSVNAITKKPLPTPQYSASASLGTWGRYRGEIDLTGPLSKDNKLLYRLNAGYQSDPDYRDFVYRNNFLIAPSLSYQINKTQINAEFVYNKVDKTFWYDWGYPVWNNDVFAIPLSYTPHEPTDKVVYSNAILLLELNQEITRALSFHSRFNSSQNRTDGQAHSPTFFNPMPDPADSMVSRVYREMVEDNSGTYFSNFLTWKPVLGKVRFTVTGGVDYFRTKYFYNINQAGFSDGVPKLHVFNPSYRTTTSNSYNVSGGFYAFDFTNFTGGYLMGLVELSDKLKIMIAGRYDSYSFKSFPGKTPNDTKAFLPNLGLTYQPLNGLSLYGSYSKGFLPQNSQSPDTGGPFEPEYSSQVEAGFKKDFFNGKWNLTSAYYVIERENVLVPEYPSNPFGKNKASGTAKSKGFEFDVAGEIIKNWNLKGGYAYNDSKITSSTFDFVLKRQATNAPYNSANLWTRYNFVSGILKGFGISAGVAHVGDRTTNGSMDTPSASLVTLPAYTVFDAAVMYKYSNITLNLYCDNLLNERYIAGASNAFYLYPGKPRNLMLRVQMTL